MQYLLEAAQPLIGLFVRTPLRLVSGLLLVVALTALLSVNGPDTRPADFAVAAVVTTAALLLRVGVRRLVHKTW